ncbi:MAG: desulfoferrodoxin [Oscillibacter sp.]|jgi:superoxide reductase|nr:desulfoferrodoxin [Oscillibacter sp.]
MSELKFYLCRHCGNLIAMVHDSGVPVICCGEKMQEIVPNTVDAAREKHLPVLTREGNLVTVTVGSVPHPMAEEHFIEWICLETKEGRQRRALRPGREPAAVFALTAGDEPVAAYAYCNLHGLWKTEI